MLKRIKNSIAFRLPAFYKLALGFKKPYNKNVIHTGEYCMVILCGSGQITMLRECLRSIYVNFEKLPQVYLFTDLNTDIQHCKKEIAWFPEAYLNLISGKDCISYHQQKRNTTLAAFAGKNPMGLKLAAILQVQDMGKAVLYTDTDVLWYGDPLPVINNYLKDDAFEIAMSEDFQPAYDTQLITNAHLDVLNQPPYFCAGIMIVKSLSEENTNRLASLSAVAEVNSNHFTEQTMFAFLNRQSHNIALNKDEFLINTNDQFSLRPKPIPYVIARHYIGPVRHLFWRDALWLN